MNKVTNVEHLSSSQYHTADNVRARWDLYNFTVPKIDIHQTGIERLRLSGHEAILDVGCGDGSVLVQLRTEGHKGRLVGLEINNTMFQESARKSLTPPVEFMVGSADTLPFPDQSFDIVLAFFMLYHMPDIQKTLIEWNRVLKNDGKVLIATSSIHSKPKNKAFKKMAESLIGKKASQHFSSSFNLENGERQLKGILKVAETFIYEGEIRITDAEPQLDSFNSLKDMYHPLPTDSEWENVQRAIREEVEREIAKNGYFADDVKRGLFICKKL
jgi:ubiquinone/menaquinone biosynthesis C-methylase UbiE